MSTRHPTPPLGLHEAGRELPPGFTSLYRAHYGYVWRCAQRLGAAGDEIDDLVQETFVVALRRLDDFDAVGVERSRPTQLSTWLFGILRNVMRNHHRGRLRSARKRAAYAQLHADAHADAGVVEHALALELLDRFLGSLAPALREVFVLVEIEGQDSRTVGAALGLNPNTVRTRLRAARRAFADEFESAGPTREQAIAVGRGRERTLRAIAVGGVGGISRDVAISKLGFDAWWVKLSLSSLVLATVTFVAIVPLSRASTDSALQRDSQRVRQAMSQPSVSGPVSTPEPPPAADIPIAAPAPTEQPTSAPARARRSSLDHLRRLSEARDAMLDGDPERTLALLRRWPTDDVEQTKRVRALEIGALCALDRGDEAEALARAWADAHPDRPLDDRGSPPCW